MADGATIGPSKKLKNYKSLMRVLQTNVDVAPLAASRTSYDNLDFRPDTAPKTRELASKKKVKLNAVLSFASPELEMEFVVESARNNATRTRVTLLLLFLANSLIFIYYITKGTSDHIHYLQQVSAQLPGSVCPPGFWCSTCRPGALCGEYYWWIDLVHLF